MPSTYIYVSVKRLAQLTSEGESLGGVQTGGSWPGVALRLGDTGLYVELVQFWLGGLALYEESLPAVTVDGNFGAGTEAAVRAFQSKAGLAVDGVVGRATWQALFEAWAAVQSDAGGTAYPGSPLRAGARGDAVRLIQLWLLVAASQYDLPTGRPGGIFGAGQAVVGGMDASEQKKKEKEIEAQRQKELEEKKKQEEAAKNAPPPKNNLFDN